MNIFSFEYPFIILFLAPILYCMYRCREQATPRFFVHLHFLSAKKSFLKLEWLLKIAVFVLLCFALASPIIVDKINPLNRDGKDIVLAIDASGSMNASGFDADAEISEGERLSRFEITQKIATKFIKERLEDNVGIVLYGDFAFIASPITYEKEIISDMLGYLTHGMAGQNTAIGEAVAMSVRAFKHSKAKSKIIILLTDGEHNSGEISPKDAANLAKNENIKIYTIGIGNKGEADEALLRQIAQDSGGEFFSATSVKELQEVYNKIDETESSKIKSQEYLLKDFYYWVALHFGFGILLYLLYGEARK